MSTINVDNIKDSSGGGDVAIPNHAIQIVQATATDKVSINNTNAKVLECSFSAKATGSKYYVSIISSIRKGDDTGNLDRDRSLGLGFKTGATSSSSSDYDPVCGINFQRETITGTSSSNLVFTAADAPRGIALQQTQILVVMDYLVNNSEAMRDSIQLTVNGATR